MLHLVGAKTVANLANRLEQFAGGSIVVLLNDAVYALLALDNQVAITNFTSKGNSCCALLDHLTSRGLNNLLPQQIQQITYDTLVVLTTEQPQIQAWP